MKQGLVLLKVAGMLKALMMLYVASFGPVYGYALQWWGAPASSNDISRFLLVQKIYRPIFWLGECSPAIERVMTSYSYNFYLNFASRGLTQHP